MRSLTGIYQFPFLVSALVLAAFFGSEACAQAHCLDVHRKQGARVAVENNAGWGRIAFREGLKEVERAFEALRVEKSEDEHINLILRSDTRRIFFRLQALSTLYQKIDPEVFGETRAIFKSIEDAISRVAHRADHRKVAEKLSLPEHVHIALTMHLRLHEARARQELHEVLVSHGLLSQPQVFVERIQRKIDTVRSWREDKQMLVETIVERLESLDKDVTNNIFDSSNIEKGLHELRRKLRWPMIQLQALDGFVTLKPEAVLEKKIGTWFGELKLSNPKLLESKYLKIEPTRVTEPIVFPQRKMAVLAEIVLQIGNKKDQAETLDGFEYAITQLKIEKGDAKLVRTQLQSYLNIKQIDHREESRQLQERLRKSKLLRRIVDDLRRT